jgi:hypothetical protein
MDSHESFFNMLHDITILIQKFVLEFYIYMSMFSFVNRILYHNYFSSVKFYNKTVKKKSYR